MRAAGLEQVLAQQIPLRRWGTPEDVAAACLFLASDEARYVTGINLIVDGGLSGFRDLGPEYRSFDSPVWG
jgi:NAD(P)-dependent dehydrogenase (short-subunit alcohol dehydrogenase family)